MPPNPAQPAHPPSLAPAEEVAEGEKPKPLPKGVVLGKDGKPCRSCTSVASWMAMSKAKTQPAGLIPGQSSKISAPSDATTVIPGVLPEDCPADVEKLGRSTWTFLHTLTATYPSRPSPTEQNQTRGFLSLFAQMYPCSHCAADFREWMDRPGNKPRLSSREEFGQWMCEAHNAVNDKLGKERFDCNKWEERWATGPSDGRCG